MIIHYNSSEFFWKETLLQSSLALKKEFPEDSCAYIIGTLTQFKMNDEQALAISLAQIQENPIQKRSYLYRELGDQALVQVGLFTDRVFDANYFKMMGSLAYGNASILDRRYHLSSILENLSVHFNDWVEVLNLSSKIMGLS